MLTIRVDASGPHAAVNDMLRKLRHFRRVDIGQELSAWQVEDMHRNRPFTMRSRARGRAATIVRPHSLYEVKKRGRLLKRYIRRLRRKGRYIGPLAIEVPIEIQRTSTRPYLRTELYERLHERMRTLLSEKLKWR